MTAFIEEKQFLRQLKQAVSLPCFYDILKVVTIYPSRDIKREIKRKEGTRWVKIK